jgi:acyl-CoA reductase-like NAD-dependent aldehyde dehydrogenase
VNTSELSSVLGRLAAGARRFAATDARERAELARRTALATVAVAAPWAEAAVAIKRAVPGSGSALAEELATGPMGTARLCLLTARAQLDIAERGLPRAPSAPRILHAGRRSVGGTPPALVGLDLLPAVGPSGSLHDGMIHQGLTATVRCHDPGGLANFEQAWRREVEERPRAGGVAVVLGAGNVTGLSAADVLSQVFEHGRGVLLKLHPLHAPLRPHLESALGPLVEAGLLAIIEGGADVAQAALSAAETTHVHVTGGEATFRAIVWGCADPSDRSAAPLLSKPITCELGNVTPWFILPGRYSRAELSSQADLVAASIANNTSFNCIATKGIVTCESWPQREDFLALVERRLASLPPRPGWYPGAVRDWEGATGRVAPADGTLPCSLFTAVDMKTDDRLLAREWFVPVVAEVPLDANDLAGFCGRALAFSHRLPGSLAASVTIPNGLSAVDARHAEDFVDHLAFGAVAVNTWSALAYALGNVPWGGFPGGTLASPKSGIGFVHDPLLLPLVHNSVIRAPLWSPIRPPWFPWHSAGARLTRGVVELYGRCAEGKSGTGTMLAMLPSVLRG